MEAMTISQLNTCAKLAIAELQAEDTILRGLLESVVSVASKAHSSSVLAPSVKALGRFAVDELPPDHSLSAQISKILDTYQAIVRAERRQKS